MSDSQGPGKERLSEVKRRLLERRMRAAPGTTGGAIERRPGSGDAPLSYGQQRLWFLHELAPDSPAYNMHSAVRLRGDLDRPALIKALGDLAARHEPLRTIFPVAGDGPVQRVQPEAAVDLQVEDLSKAARGAPLPAAIAAAGRAVQAPFRLQAGPLFRAHLFVLGPADHLLLLCLHHIICDEPSIDILWQDLAHAYAARLSGTQPSAAPERQYADFAHWQRSRSEALQQHLDYWLAALGTEPEPLQLPLDRPRPLVQRFNGAVYTQKLGAAASRSLYEISGQTGTTVFTIGMAAFAALLSRYSRERVVRIGLPVTIRDRPQLDAMVGFFLNTLVIRLDVDPERSFRALVEQVRLAVLDGYAHRALPFERLVEALKPPRDPGRNPLFDVMAVRLAAPDPPTGFPGLTAEIVDIPFEAAKFDLTFFLRDSSAGAGLLLEYNRDLFDPGTIARMSGHLDALLSNALASPDQPLSTIDLIPEEEKLLLLEGWNAPIIPNLPQPFPHAEFEQRAREQPDAPALIDARGTVTYAALDRRANHAAQALLERGLQPGQIVGLHLPHGLELFAALLGVLKAGGAYLPLDPEYPDDRLQFMLQDSGAAALITESENAFPTAAIPRILLPSGGTWGQMGVQDADRPSAQAAPDQPAYLIYTSGSTGTPKGVRVTHANLAFSTAVRRRYYQDTPSRRYLLLSSFAFDSSVAGIFWTLAEGGALVLPGRDQTRDADALVSLIAEHGVTHTLALPSLYAVLLDNAAPGQLDSLETVIVAGEACPPGLAQRHAERVPRAALFNEYGPTEATVWSTVYRFPPEGAPGHVPIGRAIPNAPVYILDEVGQLTPAGLPGELHIGGPGIAAGYHGRETLTAERFLENPFGPGRLYRTGDLVRYDHAGQIEFLGRVDHQVKIRGFRVELGEIEAALSGHALVQGAAVLLHDPLSQADDLAGRLTALDPEEAARIWNQIAAAG